MKTEEQVRAKLKEHESLINEWFSDNNLDLERLLVAKGCRTVLLWVLSDEDRITTKDELTKKIEFEIMCFESSKIF